MALGVKLVSWPCSGHWYNRSWWRGSRRQKDRTGPWRNSLSAVASVLQDPCLEGSWAARGEPTLRRTWAVSERGTKKSPVTLKKKGEEGIQHGWGLSSVLGSGAQGPGIHSEDSLKEYWVSRGWDTCQESLGTGKFQKVLSSSSITLFLSTGSFFPSIFPYR